MTKSYPTYIAADSQWLDSIPAHWKMGRLDHVARAWPSNVDKHSVEGELPVRLCNYTDVYKNDAIVDGMPFMAATATAEQVERFRIRIGDTIITKDSETADDIGIPSYVAYEADDLVCGYHLSIVRPDPAEVDPKYLFWALRAQPTLGQWEVLASGVTRVGLRSGDLSKAALALPPIAEQRAIADYLDRETARIDTLIEEQQRLIEMLHERRGAVVDQLLNPPGRMQPLKRLVADVTVGIVVNPSAWYAEEGVPALRGLNIRPGAIAAEDIICLTPEGDDLHAKSRLRSGDVVMVRTGQAGAAAVIPHELDGANAIDLLIIRPGTDVDPVFLADYCNAPSTREKITHGSVGAIQGHFNVGALRELEFPSIDVAEQRDRAAKWSVEAAKIDTLIAETETFIELARERRSALITAAVTGQIDVRGAA